MISLNFDRMCKILSQRRDCLSHNFGLPQLAPQQKHKKINHRQTVRKKVGRHPFSKELFHRKIGSIWLQKPPAIDSIQCRFFGPPSPGKRFKTGTLSARCKSQGC